MNGVTVAACQSDDMHNLVVNFSNGAILEVFALMDEKDGDASRYKMICLYDKITEEERVLCCDPKLCSPPDGAFLSRLVGYIYGRKRDWRFLQ